MFVCDKTFVLDHVPVSYGRESQRQDKKAASSACCARLVLLRLGFWRRASSTIV
jgi:hypothetical protein